MPLPLQGLFALKLGVGWFVVVVALFTALTRAEKKHVPQDPDEH